ncbi:MAG: DUF1134 domain-containing protein [Hyphomicrobiaceae bacterium]
MSGTIAMRGLLIVVAAASAMLAMLSTGHAASCAREDFAQAVDQAGAALRQLNAENAPRLRSKMRALKDARGWPDAGFEEQAMGAVQDERMAALDLQANDLLAKIDTLGTIDLGKEPDCAKLQELAAASLELQATVKTKAAYTLAKLDQMIAGPAPAPAPKTKSAEATPSAPPPSPPAPKAPPRQQDASNWSTRTTPPPTTPPPASVAPSPSVSTQPSARPSAVVPIPPPGMGAEDDGYTIDEIMTASAGFFGKVSANLGAVIEYMFKNSGRPKGYILGTEGGGAFLAGVRYGKGTLYLRSHTATQQIFWHGPSLGTDVGADGSKTLFLIYRLSSPEDLYASFTGIDGSAYFVGGVGATLVTNGKVILAPIRSGVGLRLGANIGYIRFTPHSTWNPF